MSFLKSFSLAILATFFLTYVFGMTLFELTNVHVMMDGEAIEPIKVIGISALVVVLLLVITLTLVLSVFGGLMFIALISLGCIAMLFLGVFWPILLIAIVIWVLSRNKKTREYA
ncbi:MAG: hypothetical protein V5789_06430 [Colwellia sp.]